MLLRHTAYYALARGLPGLINFIALSAYTHALAPGEYGRYALTIAAVSLGNAVLFNWMQLGLLRYLPRYTGEGRELLSTVLTAYLGTAAATAGGAVVLGVLAGPGPFRSLLPLATVLLWVQAWYELNLQLMSSRLHPLRYGATSFVRAVVALGAGLSLLWVWHSAQAPLTGLLIGTVIASLLFTQADWRGVRPAGMNATLGRELIRYGLPLSATLVFGFIINSSDRVLIGWLIDEEAVGIYSASYDLAQYTLSTVTTVVGQAAYPLTVRALESEGVETARRLLSRQGLLVVAVAAPAAAGMALLSGNIAWVLLGNEFRAGAAALIPWVALASLLGALASSYYYHAFHLARRTDGQVKLVGIAAAVNFALNLLWIPRYGVQGAAWATVVAYALALALSMWYGQRYFPLPLLPRGSLRVLIATLTMAAALWPLRELRGVYALAGSGCAALAVYAAMLWLLDVGQCRQFGIRQLRRIVALAGMDR